MTKFRVEVDRTVCQGFGACVELCPGSFYLSDLDGKIVGFDAYNQIFQFISSIRDSTTGAMMSTDGTITSHLIGILSRNNNLIREGLTPVYIFDGERHALKTAEKEQRREISRAAEEEYEKAMTEGNLVQAAQLLKKEHRCRLSQY